MQVLICLLSWKQKRKEKQGKEDCGTALRLANYRWLQFCIYDQLIVQLRREDIDLEAFVNFKKIPPEMYDDVLTRVAPQIKKTHLLERANRAGNGTSPNIATSSL